MSDANNDKQKTAMEWRKAMHPNHFMPNIGAKDDFTGVHEIQLGTKLDSGKPRISLIPGEALLELTIAMTYGAKKYGEDNYKNGLSFRRLIDAAFRHLIAISDGEDVDLESGNKHVGHALASLAMLTYMMQNKPDLDDRSKK